MFQTLLGRKPRRIFIGWACKAWQLTRRYDPMKLLGKGCFCQQVSQPLPQRRTCQSKLCGFHCRFLLQGPGHSLTSALMLRSKCLWQDSHCHVEWSRLGPLEELNGTSAGATLQISHSRGKLLDASATRLGKFLVKLKTSSHQKLFMFSHARLSKRCILKARDSPEHAV